MEKRRPTAHHRAGRKFHPVHLANPLGLKVHDVARAMRAHGVTRPLQPGRAWKWWQDPGRAPACLTAPFTQAAVRAAQLRDRRERSALEDEHRLWAGVRRSRGRCAAICADGGGVLGRCAPAWS